MKGSKKADGNVLWIVATAVVVLLVLWILIIVITRSIGNWVSGSESCTGKHGDCYVSCGTLEPIPAGDAGCKGKGTNSADEVCCRVESATQGGAQTGVGANKKLINVLLNKNSLAYGTTTEAEIGKLYQITPQIDFTNLQKLSIASDANHDCSIFLKDISSGKKYAITRADSSGKPAADTLILMSNSYEIEDFSFNTPNSLVVSCNQAGDTLRDRFLNFSELDAGKTYELDIIVYDNNITTKAAPSSWNDAVVSSFYDSSHWVIQYSAYFHIKPIIDMTGIGTNWATSSDIKVTAVAPYKLTGVKVAIIKDDELKDKGNNIYDALQNVCQNLPADRFKSSLHRITAVKAGDEGINLIFYNAGKQNYQQAMYDSQLQPIPMTETLANIHLDASTIANDFASSQVGDLLSEVGTNGNNTLSNHYLCVQASVVRDKKETPRTVYVTSVNNLKLDIAPPYITNDDSFIQVNYPQPYRTQMDQLIAQGLVNSTQKVSPYYFQQYPVVKIKQCIDKSGCKSYDYYFAATNIQFNINTESVDSTAVATALALGLNYLYQYLMQKDPLNTVCPLASSTQYRSNANPEIRFQKGKQGVFCIRVKDAVGNYWLTWKPVYNPYDVLEQATAGITNTPRDSGPLVPVVGGSV